ncbi:MAG: hypothetical protein IT303_10710 [Dehalococcoidia bacterium]|nr:hypothetical protein [Dehalococcoidia bacterium]
MTTEGTSGIGGQRGGRVRPTGQRFDSMHELMDAAQRRLGRVLASDTRRLAEDWLERNGFHDPFGAAELDELIGFLAAHDPRVQVAAGELRRRLTGSSSPEYLWNLVTEASRVLVDYAVFLASGTPPPLDAHGDAQDVGRLMSRAGLAGLVVRLGLAAEVLTQRYHLSLHSAYCVLLGDPPASGQRGERGWLFDVLVSNAAYHGLQVVDVSARQRKNERLLYALAQIERRDPGATWHRKWQLFQEHFADGSLTYSDSPAAFKVACRRARQALLR